MRAEVMARQAEALADDLRRLRRPVEEQARELLSPSEWAAVDGVYLTGDGDSYHASCAVEMAFETLGDVACRPMSAQRFLDYGAAWMRPGPGRRALVVATSASGATPRVVQAIERARHHGALTVALTSTPGSPTTVAADRCVVTELPGQEPSPGIRTYQASLMAMLLLAVELGAKRHPGRPEAAQSLRDELGELADAVEATVATTRDPSSQVAAMIGDAAAVAVVGSGPSYGTALFAAAKMVEAAGVLAVGQDLEEWWHVERFANPVDMPLFVVAPPGRAHGRAAELAATARQLGRRVVAVTHRGDTEVTRHAHAVLSVEGGVREELSPLLYHLFAGYVASHVATALGRAPFQSDRPAAPTGSDLS